MQNLNETSVVENLIRRPILRRLIWFFTLFADVPQKDAGLKWVKAKQLALSS